MTKTDQTETAGAGSNSTTESATDFKSMQSVEELVSAYNEMTITALDLGIKKIVTVQTFADLVTGVRACEHLHNLIEKTRNPPARSGKGKGGGKAKSRSKPDTKTSTEKSSADVAQESNGTNGKSKKEDNMAKRKTKKATKSKARKAVKGKSSVSASPRARIADDAKIVWVGKANPFREGSGKHKRVEAVRKGSGQTKKTILGHRVATSGTVAWCVRNGLAKVG